MSTQVGPAAIYDVDHQLTDMVLELIKARSYAVLGTQSPDGAAHIVPVWFLHDGRRFLIETRSSTRKARNVADRPRATVLVQGPAGWASATGEAHLLAGDEAQGLNEAVRDRYLTEAGKETVGALFSDVDDVTIAVQPDQWRSWTLAGTLHTLEARGVPPDPAAWFRPLDD